MKRAIHHGSLASIIAVGLTATIAQAQQTTVPDTAAPVAVASDGEILVTATKRSESLTKVPIQITVFNAAQLQAIGAVRPENILISTPNVTFITEATGDSFTNIRGQTSVRNSDPNVAVVIDGVQLSSLKQFNQDLLNIKQIEILKGPQSAIYGRNAAAGAIVVTTEEPSDHFTGHVAAGYADWKTANVQATVSGPITDRLKFTAAGSYRRTDGPFTNITTGEKVYRLNTGLGQFRLLWEPTDNLVVDFKLSGHKTTGGATALQTQLLGLPIGGVPVDSIDANRTDLPWVSDVRGVFDEDLIAASLRVEYDLGFAKFTSVTAGDRLNQFFGGDLPPYLPDAGQPGALVQGYTYHDKNFSQEFRLTSPGNQAFRWQVGVYYLNFRREQISELNVDLNGVVPRTEGVDLPGNPNIGATVSYAHENYRTTNIAPFASFQVDFTPSLHLNVAARYDIEKRSVDEIAPDAINPATGSNYNLCIATTGQTLDQCNLSRTFKKFEPKVSLSYDVADVGSVYASYGKGFKSGGFNPIGSRALLLSVAPPGAQVFVQDQYDAETSTSYELGFKARFFDRALSINGAIFQTDVSGAQQFEYFPAAGLQTITSIDKVRLRGFEFDFNAQIPGGPRVFGGYGYTDGKVKEFAANPAYIGNVSPNSLKSNLNLGITQTFELSDTLALVPRIEYNRLGTIWWDVGNTPGTRRDPVDLVNARLTLKSGDRWEIAAFADNVFNKKYNRSVLPLLGVLILTSRAETRLIGVQGRFNF
jgi:iron complex outermembrane receptor protein